MAETPGQHGEPIMESDVPARLDRLRWGRFHTLVAVALGITWVLDGLEVTITGSIAGALKSSPVLHLTDEQVGLAGSLYLVGAVLGALFFGWLTDRLGRKKLFTITLGLYLTATAATALSPDFTTFVIFRLLTGAGIGGEYAAINSAIQELIPARYRGHTDLVINGSFWIGAALGALGAVGLLDTGWVSAEIGWRLTFGIGAVLGLGILLLRRWIPESPRWLMLHGRIAEANAVVADIERRLGVAPPTEALPVLRLHPHSLTLADVARTLFRGYPRRTVLGVVLMATQAFFYNAIFFTYALVLGRFYGVSDASVGLYLLPFAAGNFLGPLLLGRLFDTWGRRPMIVTTYALSGLLLFATAWLFVHGWLDARTQTIAWSIVFFFASAAASSAYLTVSESFPLELRALAIALFYAFGTALGGVGGPWLFGTLIGSGERTSIGWGYALGASLMLIGALAAWLLGIAAERRSLEDVAAPSDGRAESRRWRLAMSVTNRNAGRGSSRRKVCRQAPLHCASTCDQGSDWRLRSARTEARSWYRSTQRFASG
ncbi:MAG: Inner membrane metabolite transport protein YgcS [Luteibacter sp.]|uniref:MFS transporter n=1 Tax=Luteibacter sp. TaxID=1886636 RepID=UPI0013821F63|nr:MFS transporter [Luteibacter sp.]KAF1009756.1 MAG: Inner membrane metabolite transport protein YgcS [Luteibacter sp.]